MGYGMYVVLGVVSFHILSNAHARTSSVNHAAQTNGEVLTLPAEALRHFWVTFSNKVGCWRPADAPSCNELSTGDHR